MIFRFRGAKILEWRRVQANAARVAFVRAAESVREAAALIVAADAACDQASRDYLTAMARPADVGTILRYRNWISKQREHAAACRRQHDDRRAVADQAAGVLQAAMRHVKVMDRLRERAWRRHLDAERRQEMKEIDQIASVQYARRNASLPGEPSGSPQQLRSRS